MLFCIHSFSYFQEYILYVTVQEKKKKKCNSQSREEDVGSAQVVM